MHRKFLIGSRICTVFGALSGLALFVIWFFKIQLTLPAPIAYFMLFSILLTVLCLLIGFALDMMSHLIRKEMTAFFWLLVLTVAIAVIQIVVNLVSGTAVDYTSAVYSSFMAAAGLRGLWYIVGIRPYEVKFK